MTGTLLTVSDDVFHIHIVIEDPTHEVYSVKFWTKDGKVGSENVILKSIVIKRTPDTVKATSFDGNTFIILEVNSFTQEYSYYTITLLTAKVVVIGIRKAISRHSDPDKTLVDINGVEEYVAEPSKLLKKCYPGPNAQPRPLSNIFNDNKPASFDHDVKGYLVKAKAAKSRIEEKENLW